MFDFDHVIDRRGTHSTKWDMMAQLSGVDPKDGIPMWVADMDFAAPAGVTAALREEIERATHGYYGPSASWSAALKEWLGRRHGMDIETSWVSQTPGIVSGLGLILQAVTEPGDEVIIFTPGYHVFPRIILANGRRVIGSQLELRDGRYAMDLEGLKAKVTAKTKAVFYCSPHNPGGTVWTREETRALALFCLEHKLMLVSDEIHCDLLLGGARHTPALRCSS